LLLFLILLTLFLIIYNSSILAQQSSLNVPPSLWPLAVLMLTIILSYVDVSANLLSSMSFRVPVCITRDHSSLFYVLSPRTNYNHDHPVHCKTAEHFVSWTPFNFVIFVYYILLLITLFFLFALLTYRCVLWLKFCFSSFFYYYLLLPTNILYLIHSLYTYCSYSYIIINCSMTRIYCLTLQYLITVWR